MSKKALVVTSTYPRWENDSVVEFVQQYTENLLDQKVIEEALVLAPHFPGARTNEVKGKIKIRRFRYLIPESLETVAYEGVVNKLKGSNLFYKIRLVFLLVSMLFHVLWYALVYRPGLIHVHWLIPQGFFAVLTKFIHRKPVIITIHGGDIFSLNSPAMIRVKRFTLKHANTVAVNSSATLSAAKEVYDRDYVCISEGVAADRFSPKTSPRNDSKQSFSVLFVGRLTEEKGVQVLLRAIASLKENRRDIYDNISATIAGSGPYESVLKEMTNDKDLKDIVSFHGWVAHKQLDGLFQKADAFVGPSLTVGSGWREAFGIVFAEGLASETPVVASKSGGIVDIIVDGENGIFTSEEDHESIADALISLYDNPDKARAMGLAGRKRVLQLFDWPVVSSKYADLYRELQ